jgi:hypothetical protein
MGMSRRAESEQAELNTHMGRKQLEIVGGPGGLPRAWQTAIFWRRCRWAFCGMLKLKSALVVNFLRLCSGPRTWTRTCALRSWLGPPELG